MHHTVFHVKGMKLSEFGQPFDVCDTLLKPHHGKNYQLFVDNYYTSIPLCDKLLDKDIYVTGTVCVNHKGLPAQVKTKQKVKGDIIAVRIGQLLSTRWMDCKQIMMLSTSSTAAPVEVTGHKQTC